jgi:hypothetical protein
VGHSFWRCLIQYLDLLWNWLWVLQVKGKLVREACRRSNHTLSQECKLASPWRQIMSPLFHQADLPLLCGKLSCTLYTKIKHMGNTFTCDPVPRPHVPRIPSLNLSVAHLGHPPMNEGALHPFSAFNKWRLQALARCSGHLSEPMENCYLLSKWHFLGTGEGIYVIWVPFPFAGIVSKSGHAVVESRLSPIVRKEPC